MNAIKILLILNFLFFSHRNTINPNNMLFTMWTALTVGVSCVYFITLGLQVSFLQDSHFLLILNYCFDLFFFVDM